MHKMIVTFILYGLAIICCIIALFIILFGSRVIVVVNAKNLDYEHVQAIKAVLNDAAEETIKDESQ